MPPDITAGLTALAGAPPGAAASAAPLPEPLGTSLFAVFLAQSSLPSVIPAALKAAPTQALPIDLKQTPLEKQALPKKQTLLNLKTMDTLPPLPFPALPRSKASASELPLPQVLQHQKPAEDQLPAQKMPESNVPSPAPPHAGQATAPLIVLIAPPVIFAPVLMTPAAAVTVSVTAAPGPIAAAPGPIAAANTSLNAAPILAVPMSPDSAASPVQTAPEAAAPVPFSRLDTPAVLSPHAAAPGQIRSALPAPAQAVPAQIGLPLPRTWAITAPVQAVPQPVPTVVTSAGLVQTALEPKAASLLAVKSTPVTAASVKPAPAMATAARVTATNGLLRVPNPVSAALFQAVPQPQGILPETLPDLSPLTAQATQNILALSPAIATAAGPLPARGTPVGPTKITGKFLPAALKPVGENADTSTRTAAGQMTEAGTKADPKAGVPAAAPGPVPEKHTEEQPSEAAVGTNSVPAFSSAAPAAGTVKADKPLSAGERAEVVRQAAEGVGAMPLAAKPGAPEQMSVQLHPKDWGSLQVSVTVAPSQDAGAAKTVTAHIVAETPQVKAALQSGTGALHQALRASGLHLEHLTISVKTPDTIKPPEVKAPEVKPAAQSASAGLPSGQGQSSQTGPPNTGATGYGTGGSQNGRQGQPPPPLTSAQEPETEDNLIPVLPLRPASGRIDTHA